MKPDKLYIPKYWEDGVLAVLRAPFTKLRYIYWIVSNSTALPDNRKVYNYRSTLRLVIRFMTSKKAFVMERYFIPILSREIKYQTFVPYVLSNQFDNTCFVLLYFMLPGI